MNDPSKELERKLRKKVREFWFSIIVAVEDPEAILPEGADDQQKTLAYYYYIALIQTAKAALDGMAAEDARLAQEEALEPKITPSSRRVADVTTQVPPEDLDLQTWELNEKLKSGKLIHIDDMLANADAVFESARNDMLTVPLNFTVANGNDFSLENFREICARELETVAARLMDELAQAIRAAVRESQKRAF